MLSVAHFGDNFGIILIKDVTPKISVRKALGLFKKKIAAFNKTNKITVVILETGKDNDAEKRAVNCIGNILSIEIKIIAGDVEGNSNVA